MRAFRRGVVVLPVLLAGCLATKQDVEELRTELQAGRVEQQRQIDQVLRRTEALLDSLADQNVRLRGDLNSRLTQIERQLVQIQELTGQGQQQLAQLRRQIDDRARDDARRAAEARDSAGGTSSPTTSGDPAEAQELYDASLAALRRGSLGTARAGFEEFLRANPQHRLAADAQFNVGEAYAQGRDTDNALAAFERVVERYPSSARAPAALLRMGRLELGRDNRTEARARFQQLTRAYPRAPEAAEAQRELTRLGRG
ncbi:MAG TPA: tol-pal system protein YbgF [Longimicrobiaceae bacterium]|nr:tol-pal system protein YbgF [Longimicrobiaceae bacterium]